MAAFMRRLKGRAPPDGWELLESTIEEYEGQMRDAVAEDHEGKRKNETTWRIHRIHFEKNRFIFDLMYKRKALSKELYDYLVREKIADGGLIAKWRKPGYENLCSMLAIQKGDHNFGTTSICRVPIGSRAGHQLMSPDVKIGCISCASGDGINGGPIWWNTPVTAADLEKKGKKGQKRAAEEPLDEEVKQRLAALAGSGLGGVD